MKIIISNLIRIEEPTSEILNYCNKCLTFSNPDYQKKVRMGVWIGNTPKSIKLYNVGSNYIEVPLGCFNDIYKIVKNPTEFIDYSVSKKRKIQSSIKLREYQKPCVQAVKDNFNGLLILPAGLGKTESALEVANSLQEHTLWIAHTTDLIKQAEQRCKDKMKCKTSFISEGKCDTSGDIVFAAIQTLVSLIDKGEIDQDEFGLMVVDECQHIGVNGETVGMFQKGVNYFACRYKIGLTATLHRSDKLACCIPKILGDIIYEVKKDETSFYGIYNGKEVCRVPLNDFRTPISIEQINTHYEITSDKDVYNPKDNTIVYSKLITDICMDKKRNNLIIKKLLENKNNYNIVLSDRVDHLKYLNRFVDNGIVIDGKTKKDIRVKAIQDMRDGKINYLFGSYKLVSEGLDCPILDRLYLCSPNKDFRLIVQTIGRIQRKHPNKETGIVYDFYEDVGPLIKFRRERNKIYKNENLPTKVVDN